MTSARPPILSDLEIACDLAVIDHGSSIPPSHSWPEDATWADMVHARDRVKQAREAAKLAAEPVIEIPRPLRVIDDRPALSGLGKLLLAVAIIVVLLLAGLLWLLTGPHPMHPLVG